MFGGPPGRREYVRLIDTVRENGTRENRDAFVDHCVRMRELGLLCDAKQTARKEAEEQTQLTT